MVEYAILVAHNTAGTFRLVAGDVSSWVSRLDWDALVYVLLAFVLFRVALGAFTRPRF
jgi:hypothetical protein